MYISMYIMYTVTSISESIYTVLHDWRNARVTMYMINKP